MRLARLATAVLVLGLFATAVWADSWCATRYPAALFCDDFDRYCDDPPPLPQECGLGYNILALWRVWIPQGSCGAAITLDDGYLSSPPYAGRAPSPDTGQLAYDTLGLTSPVRAKFGEQYTSVLATDETPLTFEFVVNGKTLSKIHHDNAFLELANGTPYVLNKDALTLWIPSPYCDEQCGNAAIGHNAYPIICQQNDAPAGCASIATAPPRSSIAVGAMAYLDPDPCHCSASDHFPTNKHLAVFDGQRWWSLRQGLFPGGGTGGAVPGDFWLGDLQNKVVLTIKLAAMKVEMTWAGADNLFGTSDDQYSWCTMPRIYQGPFNKITMGYHIPCELIPGTWNCTGAADCNGPTQKDTVCCVTGAPGGGTITFDNVALDGGQGYVQPGACCFPDTSCVEAYEGDCRVLGGQFAGGGTTCDAVACCPPLPADHDMDGDVDLEDFGWFQSCLSGPRALPWTIPCQCADFNHDTGVDADDLATFLIHMSGPEIPAN